jgi:D-amino peptidase
VPIALITGDQVTIAEAGPFAAGAEQAVVKESITRFAARQLHPEQAREMIRGSAETAVRRAGSMAPPDLALPARLEVETQTADMAELASWVKGVERSGTRSVRIEADDPLAVYRSFVAVTYITRVAEGR